MDVENNVIFYGVKNGSELDEMFNKCHIALDALAAFRKGLKETSSLKSREYCSRGMPFIVASHDNDFPKKWEYRLEIPADESPVDMNSVIEFTKRVLNNPTHPQIMRKFAERNLDWKVKIKELKKFIENI